MTNKTTETLTNEKFQEIYTSEKFRNQSSYAPGCQDSNGVFKYKQTCSFPVTYINVTDAQIKEATKERERATKDAYKRYKNVLLFVGMGMTYTKAEHNDDILNHRISTEFKANDGRVVFVELGTMPE